MHSVAVWQHEALFVQKEIINERVKIRNIYRFFQINPNLFTNRD